MVVLESGSIGYDQNVNMDLQLDPSVQSQEQSSKDNAHPSMSGTKQNSIFSLTLDEIQCKSGRNFGSMNMDEFLANIWSVEEDSQISLPQPNQGDQDSSYNDMATSQPKPLSREGSFSIPIPLCKKTVDEVWSEIDKNRPQYHDTSNNTSNFGLPQRQQTIGEITLEDFLVKAGVVQEWPSKSKTSERRIESTPMEELCGNTNMGNNMSTCLDTNYGIGGQVFVSGFMNPQTVVSSNLIGSGYSTTYPMLARQCKLVVTEPSSGSAIEKFHSLPESSSGSGGKNKKRIVDGPTEVAVERRQRRMIKNRESAARSRARKQAYTVELEAEWNQLKEENAMLKQSVAESEQRRKQELLRRKHSTRAQKLAEKMRTMRRAVSLAL